MDPGAYSMTVLVRRAGSKVAYDSHVDTRSFWIESNNISNNNVPTKNVGISSVEDINISIEENETLNLPKVVKVK